MFVTKFACEKCNLSTELSCCHKCQSEAVKSVHYLFHAMCPFCIYFSISLYLCGPTLVFSLTANIFGVKLQLQSQFYDRIN